MEKIEHQVEVKSGLEKHTFDMGHGIELNLWIRVCNFETHGVDYKNVDVFFNLNGEVRPEGNVNVQVHRRDTQVGHYVSNREEHDVSHVTLIPQQWMEV